jgi:hypothetical protein
MLKALLIIAVVVGVLIGGLMTLRRSARTGMPDEQVLKRAADRAREQEAKERGEQDR